MNADKLAEALRTIRDLLVYQQVTPLVASLIATCDNVLAEYDTQPAQASQPVGVPDGTTPFWVIERHNNSVLEYWSIGYLGSGDVHQWSCNINDATKFWNPASAGFVLSRLLSGIGNVVQHGYIAAPQPPAQPSALDSHEFGCGVENSPKTAYWQERARFWREKAIALGYPAANEREAAAQPSVDAEDAARLDWLSDRYMRATDAVDRELGLPLGACNLRDSIDAARAAEGE